MRRIFIEVLQKVIVSVALLTTGVPALAAITHLGMSVTPSDNTAQTDSASISLSPVNGMVAGDLVIVEAVLRDLGETISVNASGGQSWTAGTQHSSGSHRTRLFYCIFNGTWSGNPSWQTDIHFGSPFSLLMDVYRPSSSGTWSVDVAESFTTGNGSGTPAVDHTISGQTSTGASSVTLAIWSDADKFITWSLQTAGWSNAGGAQLRNSSGSGLSISLAYKIQTAAGATGSVTNRASNTTFTHRQIVTFKHSAAPPTFTAPTISSVVPCTGATTTCLRITHTAVTSADHYRVKEAVCTNNVPGTFSVLTQTHTGLVYDRTGLATANSRSYQVAAATADESVIGPYSTSSACATTSSASPSAINHHPGFYVEHIKSDDDLNVGSDEGPIRSFAQVYNSLPAPWAGLYKSVLLGHWETTAGDYTRLDDWMTSYLESAHAGGKHLIIQFSDKFYNGWDPNGLPNGNYFPTYLMNDAAYNNSADPANHKGVYVDLDHVQGGLSVGMRTWVPNVMDRMIAAGEYLCAHYGNDPALEGITWDGFAGYNTYSATERAQNGYTWAAYRAQVERWMIAMRAACPHLQIGIRNDWPASMAESLAFWANMQPYHIFGSSFDTADFPTRTGSVNPGDTTNGEEWGVAGFRGACTAGGPAGACGADLRGVESFMSTVESPDFTYYSGNSRMGVTSYAEFLDICHYMHCDYMIITPDQFSTTPSWFSPPGVSDVWHNIIRPCIENGTGCSNYQTAISTSCPIDYPSCM